MLVHEVPAVYITRDNASLEKQHSMAATCKQHRRDRTCAARSNHNHVEHVTSAVSQLLQLRNVGRQDPLQVVADTSSSRSSADQ
jgi:hypothetical protein